MVHMPHNSLVLLEARLDSTFVEVVLEVDGLSVDMGPLICVL